MGSMEFCRSNRPPCESKYLDFARELKKQWNMKEIVIVIIVNALETVSKSLERKRKIET